jgi:hypothetical protein
MQGLFDPFSQHSISQLVDLSANPAPHILVNPTLGGGGSGADVCELRVRVYPAAGGAALEDEQVFIEPCNAAGSFGGVLDIDIEDAGGTFVIISFDWTQTNANGSSPSLKLDTISIAP